MIIPEESILAARPFNMFINKLDDGLEGTVSKCADDSKLGIVNKMPTSSLFLELDKLEKWAERNLMKFNKGRGKVLHHKQNKYTQEYRLGDNWLTAGDQLTYKIAQAGTLFLEVHSGRTRGNRHSIKP
ncbi:hypothetical protein FK515_28610, partial [Klebsiella pneumoniae]|nr:hypothetical protein [Klebsiella pneumoniae]